MWCGAQEQDNLLVGTCTTESKQQWNKVAVDDECPRLSTVSHTFNIVHQHMPIDQGDFWVGTDYDLFVDLKKKTKLWLYSMEKITDFQPFEKNHKRISWLNVFKCISLKLKCVS